MVAAVVHARFSFPCLTFPPVRSITLSRLMCEYIEFCADRLLLALGCEKAYHSRNPFDWMDLISLQVGWGVNGPKAVSS